MRLFVALNLPDRERAGIHRAAASLRESTLPVRWVPAENLHVTLAFLGEVDEGRVDPVGQALRWVGAQHAPLTLEVGGVGAFPTPRRPRVLWIGAEGGSALRALQRGVQAALEPLGFAPDERSFHPHVTLGRARRHAGPRDFGEFAAMAETVDYRQRVGIGTVDLMQSRGSPSGVRYRAMLRCPLGGAG